MAIEEYFSFHCGYGQMDKMIRLASISSIVTHWYFLNIRHELRWNPQISAPTICMPNIWNKKLPLIDSLRNSHVATLSPVQWPAYAPVPTLLLLDIIKALPFFFFKKS